MFQTNFTYTEDGKPDLACESWFAKLWPSTEDKQKAWSHLKKNTFSIVKLEQLRRQTCVPISLVPVIR